MDKLLERFLHYVSLDTQSKSGVRQVPSTEGQWKLLRLLKQQLEEMGLVNITLTHIMRLLISLWDVGTVFFTIYPQVFRHEKSSIYYKYIEPLSY
ncbi:hypothetical protein V5G68_12925, partial [Salmonella enterica subsp. enterica serovar Heidelberg]